MQDLIIGIDLGTTNSEVAIVENGQPRVIAIDGDPILPSVVGLSSDDKLLVGKPARNQYVLAPERTVKSVKRQMGLDLKIPLGTQQFRPQEVSAMILRRLKEAAEKDLGQAVHKAVITVPAYFNDSQRQATREAGQLAGLEVVRILNEPTAAALTYRPNPDTNEKFLVYDLGGGTFDVSIVQAEGGVFEVLSSHGDTQLGGDDFDELLLNHIADEFQELYQIDLRANLTTKARLLRAVENAKKTLSDHAFARIEEEFIAEKDGVPLHLTKELERSTFEQLIDPLLRRTMDCLQKALDDAKINASDLKQVVLVGGSTRSPVISRLLEARLGQPAHREVHPDLCVAMGAAIQAAIIAGSDVGAVLVDITPHSVGIKSLEVPDSFSRQFNEFKFAPIVPRNTPLPTSRSEIFCTVMDNQAKVDIDIFQGESGDVRRNHRVGKFLIEGLARVPAGNQLVVQMELTLDGTLKVTAREKATGLMKNIVIDNAMARFAVEEKDAAQSRLDRMWAEPEWKEGDDEPMDPAKLADLLGSEPGAYDDDEDDDDEDEGYEKFPVPEPEEDPAAPRFQFPADAGATTGQREAVQARALLEKAERVGAKANAEDQAELGRLTAKVKSALDERRWPDLQSTSNALADVLFYLEDA
jgi:molecular chaperone DnaK